MHTLEIIMESWKASKPASSGPNTVQLYSILVITAARSAISAVIEELGKGGRILLNNVREKYATA
jgi:hypothetical protein